ncbi:SDR family NAD(P)-dependent oxidoreductase [Gordonia otitidis]|uniref:SDR family NAD(P)-dependent oxidoreductase n=1 Tax=Gordonia otitidis TaxID=249058 RepID=UPI002353A52E|nr:SDR family oxidoreductase [Gordonia otitidis]
MVAEPFGELEVTRARFADLTVVIIGGSSDIGKACAAVALREGGTVVLTGRNRGSLQSAAAELSPIGPVGMVELDVTDPSSVGAFTEVLGVDHSHIDVLVIASGQTRVEPRNGVTADHFDSVMAVNARGPYLVMNTVLPMLRPGSSIVCVTSAVSHRRGRGMTAYAASKAALETIVRTVALDVADRGIRVNAVAPGPTATAGLHKPLHATDNPAIRVERIAASLPRGQLTNVDEVAHTIMFLSSAEASGINASTVTIDGGWNAA